MKGNCRWIKSVWQKVSPLPPVGLEVDRLPVLPPVNNRVRAAFRGAALQQGRLASRHPRVLRFQSELFLQNCNKTEELYVYCNLLQRIWKIQKHYCSLSCIYFSVSDIEINCWQLYHGIDGIDSMESGRPQGILIHFKLYNKLLIIRHWIF